MNKALISIGVDLGGTHIKIGMLRDREIVTTRKLQSKAEQSINSRLPLIAEAIDDLLIANDVSPASLMGIGLAFPSIVDNQRARILSRYVKFSDADEIDLRAWARKHWKIPLVLENDARAALVGEWQFGAGQGYQNLVMITLGTGVGSAVLIEGKLFRGAHHMGGNLGGHTIININGKECNCGSFGCVETEASGWVIHNKFLHHPMFSQSVLAKHSPVTYREVFQGAEEGDELAVEIREHSLRTWAANALNFVHHFDPELLILGGGIMQSAKFIIPYIQDFVDRHSWLPPETVDIIAARQVDYAGVLGMCFLASHQT